MHKHDLQERLVTKHPGTKNRLAKLAGNAKQRRRDQRLRRRAILAARIETLNKAIVINRGITDEAKHD